MSFDSEVYEVSALVAPCSYKQGLIYTWQLSKTIIYHYCLCNLLDKEFLSNLVLFGMVGHKELEKPLTLFFFNFRISAELNQILRMVCAGFQASVVNIVVSLLGKTTYLPCRVCLFV